MGTSSFTPSTQGETQRFARRQHTISFFAIRFARRRSCHPGWVDTPAVEEAYGSKKKFLEPMRNGWQGAEGIAWLMSTKQVIKVPRSEATVLHEQLLLCDSLRSSLTPF